MIRHEADCNLHMQQRCFKMLQSIKVGKMQLISCSSPTSLPTVQHWADPSSKESCLLKQSCYQASKLPSKRQWCLAVCTFTKQKWQPISTTILLIATDMTTRRAAFQDASDDMHWEQQHIAYQMNCIMLSASAGLYASRAWEIIICACAYVVQAMY